MARTATRRPLPALVALLALLVLTGLVWWRVLTRDTTTTADAHACPTHTAAHVLPATRTVTVEVLNSTSRAGIAGDARAALVQAGFSIPSPAKDDSAKLLNKIKVVAEIRYPSSLAQGAALVHYYFPGARMRVVGGKAKIVVVSLGTKYKAVATPTAVAKALLRADAQAGTAAPSPSPTC